MKNYWVKKLFIILGILAIIFLVVNVGINFWLQYKLPGYIKNNTDYTISYNRLDIDLGTGNIIAEGISVNNKNPQNISVIGLQGTIDTLKISRFGIYDALFNKKINSTDLLLSHPNLNIVLPKPVDEKTGKKPNPLVFKNIRINKGSITIFKYNKEKFLGVKNLKLWVENLQMTEESVEKKLPIVFDKYSIEGQDFYVQLDSIYAIKIGNIKTQNAQMSVERLQLQSLISFSQFKNLHPSKRQMYNAEIQKVIFKDVAFKNNTISLNDVQFINPIVDIFSTGAPKNKTTKNISFEINLQNTLIRHLKLRIHKPNGEKLLSAEDFNITGKKLVFNKVTSEDIIPIRYQDFKLSGKDIIYSDEKEIKLSFIEANPKKIGLKNIVVKNEDNSDLKINQLNSSINQFGVRDKKLYLDVNTIFLEGINGIFKQYRKESVSEKSSILGIHFPIIINNIALKNSNLTYEQNNQPLSFKNLNAEFSGVELHQNKKGSGLATKVKDFHISIASLAYKTKFYQLSMGNFMANKDKLSLQQFMLKPLYSRSQFIKMIPVERDLYDIKFHQLTAIGQWDFFSPQSFMNAQSVEINNINANIFRSKIPTDDPTIKPLYSALLRSVKLPFYIENLNVKNSYLEYEEDTKKSSGPGKLVFSNFNMNVKHLNSAKIKGKPTNVGINIGCRFMRVSPMDVKWNFNTADISDNFAISGKVTTIPATSLNSFIVPYLSVSATGTIQEMLFNFKGNPQGLNGSFNLKHQDLKVSILKRESKEKRKLLSAVANLFIKSSSDRFPESVEVTNVERDATKSFFNLFWKGLQEGLKKTLIGKNKDNKERKVSQSLQETKSALQETKLAIQTAKQNFKEVKNNFKNIKNKKNTAEKDMLQESP